MRVARSRRRVGRGVGVGVCIQYSVLLPPYVRSRLQNLPFTKPINRRCQSKIITESVVTHLLCRKIGCNRSCCVASVISPLTREVARRPPASYRG